MIPGPQTDRAKNQRRNHQKHPQWLQLVRRNRAVLGQIGENHDQNRQIKGQSGIGQNEQCHVGRTENEQLQLSEFFLANVHHKGADVEQKGRPERGVAEAHPVPGSGHVGIKMILNDAREGAEHDDRQQNGTDHDRELDHFFKVDVPGADDEHHDPRDRIGHHIPDGKVDYQQKSKAQKHPELFFGGPGRVDDFLADQQQNAQNQQLRPHRELIVDDEERRIDNRDEEINRVRNEEQPAV